MRIDPLLEERLSNIRLVALDCDGVLTDGRLFYGEHGEALKTFNVKDGQGIVSLLKAGIEVAVITARSSKALEHRCRELGIRYLRQSAGDKLSELKEILNEIDGEIEQVAYVGDDLGDVSVMSSSGVGFAVADSSDVAKEVADLITTKDGGFGAVREVADIILKLKHK